MNENELCRNIVNVAQVLHARNLLAAADGNISYRLNDQRILMTPSGVAKARMNPEQMAVVDLQGRTMQGHASSELSMHLTIYRHCPQARCVVHAHPPTAVAWSVAKPELQELPSDCLSEVILSMGSIPIIPYARPGTAQMGERFIPFLPHHRAMILSRHGAITWGESLEEALGGMERIEHTSEMLWKAQMLGGLTSLPPEEVAFLKARRRENGERLL